MRQLQYSERSATTAAAAPTSAPVVAAPINTSLPATRLEDLYRLAMPKLFALAEKEGITEHTGMNRSQLIMSIVRRQVERGVPVKGSGTLEVLPRRLRDFSRSTAHTTTFASPEDIYVSLSQIRRVGLKTGLIVEGPDPAPRRGAGQLRPHAGRSRQRALAGGQRLVADHLRGPGRRSIRNKRLVLETSAEEISMRVIDLVTPIGRGQRGLIVSPPRAGKTILLQKIALSLLKNHPDAYLIVLLVDERPEEVTDMARRTVSGLRIAKS